MHSATIPMAQEGPQPAPATYLPDEPGTGLTARLWPGKGHCVPAFVLLPFSAMLKPLTTADFEDLTPLARALRDAQRHCKPFSADYHAIQVALAGLNEAAEAVTGEASFYGSRADTIGPVRR